MQCARVLDSGENPHRHKENMQTEARWLSEECAERRTGLIRYLSAQ